MKKLIIVLFLIVFTVPGFAQDESFCNDKESWKEWNKLAQKYPHARCKNRVLHKN